MDIKKNDVSEKSILLDNNEVEDKILFEKNKTIYNLKEKLSLYRKILFAILIIGIPAVFFWNKNITRDKEHAIYYITEKHETEIKTLNEKITNIKKEYSDYKNKMQPYENLEKAEKEQKEAELKAKREQKEKAEKEQKEAELQKKLEEEKKGYDTGITYDDLARKPDEYIGKKVTFSGTVIQVIRGDITDQYRIKVNDDYKKVIFVEYTTKDGENKILEDDKVIVKGKSIGEVSYKSTMGGKISIPGISADFIDIK